MSIYKSEYGKERMKEDGLKGPQEIREIPDDENTTMNEEEREKLVLVLVRLCFDLICLKYYTLKIIFKLKVKYTFSSVS